MTEQHWDTIDFRVKTTLASEKEQPMTAYRERREAGYYDAAVAEAPPDEPAPDEPAPEESDDDNGATLKELQAQAEERGLPTYGTKAQLAERIADHDAE